MARDPKPIPKRERRDTVQEPAVRRRKERESMPAPRREPDAEESPPPEPDAEEKVDEAGEESFPASDSPSFTPEKTGK